MAAQIYGYDVIEKLYESSRTAVYRARNRENGRNEILKLLGEGHPAPHALVRYRHEFDITKTLDADGVIEVYRLEDMLRGKMLVFEDIGGVSLADARSERHFDIDEFLDLAIKIAQALGQVHAQGVIHKDLNPSNIVWNPETGQIKLIDFGIATTFARAWPDSGDANESVGTLAYMSPEQTGRTNRRLDYRTDFYSLGATLYELLTGRRCCEGDDDVELFHCHLAVMPCPPNELRADVPEPVSQIIMKLLAKPAEQRYQSAHGLICDLKRCLDEFQTNASVGPFELGADDVRATLQISQELYGRRPQLDRLLDAIERAGRGGAHLVLISGKAGVGKSALVRETRQPILGRRAQFVGAKFHPNERDIPYSAFTEAFEALLSMPLALPSGEVGHWRERVQHALESNGALLGDIAPTLYTLVGKQPAPPKMAPDEARHRLARVVRRFIELFCEPERPLTIFLDDLQWADSASLELMAALLTDERVDHLLFIGAYRDHGPTPSHRLDTTLQRLEEAGASLEHVPVGPLSPDHVRELIADTLQLGPEAVSALAELIHEKTSGNPYFVNRFLEDIYARDLLWFDAHQGIWCWELDAIRDQMLTDNVVDLLIERLRKLPRPTQEALQMAALLGTYFHLDQLAAVCETSPPEVFGDLTPALEAGIVLPRSRTELSSPDDSEAPIIVRRLAFAHDRVQEAAAHLLFSKNQISKNQLSQNQISKSTLSKNQLSQNQPSQQWSAAHLKVGRLLHKHLQDGADASVLFDVVHHLNEGRKLIEQTSERLELARLNVHAARKSMASLAFASASTFLEVARDLLGDNIWQLDAELAFEVLHLRAEAASFEGHFELAEQLFDQAMDHCDDPVQRSQIYTSRVRQYANQAEFARAQDATVQGLGELGIDFNPSDLDSALAAQFSRVQDHLGGQPIATIVDVPRVDHPVCDAALQLLAAFQPSAGLMDQRLLLLDGLKAIELSLEVGVRPHTVVGLAVYGLVLVAHGRFEEACEAGELSLELAAEFDDDFSTAHAGLLHGAMIALWARPLDEAIEVLERAQQAGMRSGNLQFAGFATASRLYQQFCRGKELSTLAAPLEHALAFARRSNNRVGIDQCLALGRLTQHLLGELDDEAFVYGRDPGWGEDSLAFFAKHHDEAVEANWRCTRGALHFLYDRPARALEDFELVDLPALLNSIVVSRCVFYKAMAHAQLAHELDGDDQVTHLEELSALRSLVASWAASSAFNFEHQLTLLDAEIAWLSGAVLEAIDLFDHAIELSRTRHFVEIEALASERAAALWLARQKTRVALSYLRDAIYTYREWGARRKAEQLQSKYPELLAQAHGSRPEFQSTTSSTVAEIDITSVFQAAESIARHIEVDELLTTLMNVTIANAGAQRGTFFLADQPGGLSVAVEGDADQEPRLVEPPVALARWNHGARSVVRLVSRTAEPLVLASAIADERFQRDPYVVENELRSVLCLPVKEAGELAGILYLENNLADDAFTQDSLRVLTILAGHIAVSLSKARLYEAVHLEKERFRQLAEHIHEVFWLMDWPSQEIVYVSPAYTTTWGRPMPETPLPVDRWLDPVLPADRTHVEDAMQKELATGEYDIIYEIERPSGSRRWIRDRGFPIRRDNGQTYRIAGVAEDITRQHEVERMKDEFISVVSHELRTPLTPIKGIFEILAKNDTIRETMATEKMVDLGLRNTRRLLRLIDDLLDIQTLSMANINFDCAPVDLSEVVCEALQINEPLGQSKNIDFVFDSATPGLRVDVDRERLVQVLTNLLSNAVKFSAPSDTIDVGVTRQNDHASISVTDHGAGIPDSAREHVFEKFVQADSSLTRKHGGAGLGLAISQAIVERLGGRIYFESETGEGTTFYVELPLVE